MLRREGRIRGLFRLRNPRSAIARRERTFEALEPRLALAGTPIISEFLASNSSGLADEDGDFSDWIELYNPTTTSVNLAGWHLTDKSTNLTEWTFPSTVLDPGHFQVVFASGKDRAVAGSELHTNFKLSADGEYLALVEPDGTTIASQFTPNFPAQYSDISYGSTFTPSTQTTVTLNASADTYLSESQPTTNFSTSVVSVASSSGTNHKYGVIEWDLSGITQNIVAAHIELYNNNGRSVTQQAYVIPSGITGITWNTYNSNYKPSETALTSLGSGSFGTGGTGTFASTSSASAADLTLLNNLRNTTGKVTVVFKASTGSRDWGNLETSGHAARLVLTLGTPGTLIGDLRYFSTPTPGDVNVGGALGITPAPAISVAHGFFSSPFDTTLTAGPGATLVYTTNGTDPTLTNGIQVPAPNGSTQPSVTLHVTQTTTLRVAAFATNYIGSNIATETYLFLSDVILQSPQGQTPAGWPTGPINGQILNYGMDPDIVNRTIPGDFNSDGIIDTTDYNILTSHFAQTVPANTLGDMDGNGIVDLQDFTKFRSQYQAYQAGTVPPAYGLEVKNDLLAIPTISLVTNLSNLFDPTTGIYVNASEDGSDWERPVSVELINPDGTPGFQINAGIRIRGNFSTSDTNPKHSFRLFFDSNEGALNYPMFGSDGTTSYEKLDLRTDQNDSWAFTGSTQDTFVNDVFARDTQFAMGDPSTRSEYYHLYINGIYWGVYQSQERPSADYAASYFGGDSSDYDVIKSTGGTGGYTTEATDGNLDAWNDLWTDTQADMSNNANYFKIQGLNPDGTRNPNYPVLLDVDNLIDYMLIIFYMGNEDAPLSLPLNNNKSNNWYAIRNRNGDTGFQFFQFDAEQTLFSETNVGHLNSDRTGPFHGSNEHNFTYSNPQWIHQALMANAEYRLEFADRVQKFFYDGGALTVPAVQQRFLERAAEVKPAMVDESARWGDAYSTRVTNPLTQLDWQNAVNNDVYNYFPYRNAIVLNQLQVDGMLSSVVAPSYSQHGGTVQPNTTFTLSAPQGTIYYTLDGSDPRLIGGAISSTALVYSGPISITHSLTVNARALYNGVWSAVNTAGFQLTVPDLRITELMYHPSNPPVGTPYTAEDFEFAELQNIGTAPIDLSGIKFTQGITYTFPAMTLAVGQYVVISDNPAAFATRYPGVSVIGPYTGNLSNSGEQVTLTDAAGDTIQSFTYVDSWYPSTDGGGYSLVVVNPLAAVSSWNNSGNWRASTNLFGSPGTADPSGGAGSGASEIPLQNNNDEAAVRVTTDATATAMVVASSSSNTTPQSSQSSAASTPASPIAAVIAATQVSPASSPPASAVSVVVPSLHLDDSITNVALSAYATQVRSGAVGKQTTESDSQQQAVDALFKSSATAADSHPQISAGQADKGSILHADFDALAQSTVGNSQSLNPVENIFADALSGQTLSKAAYAPAAAAATDDYIKNLAFAVAGSRSAGRRGFVAQD